MSVSEKQREALGLVYEALGIAFPASGTQSVSVRGLSEFAADCRKILPLCRSIVLHIAVGQNYRGELDEDCERLRKVLNKSH